MPDELGEAVPLLVNGEEGWTVEQLERLRTLLWDEYVGPDRAAALDAVNRLLAQLR